MNAGSSGKGHGGADIHNFPLVKVLLLIAYANNPSRRQRGTQVLQWAVARAMIAAHMGSGGNG